MLRGITVQSLPCAVKKSPCYSSRQSFFRRCISVILAGICVVAGSSFSSAPVSAAAPHTPIMAVDASAIYGCSINSDKVRELAKNIRESGLYAAGYRLIEINDCWQSRNKDGEITADPRKFKVSMEDLAHELHEEGYQLGLSLDLTTASCQNAPGSSGYIGQDATFLSEWGIDEISVTACDKATQEQIRKNCILQSGTLFINPLFQQLVDAIAHSHRRVMITSRIPEMVANLCNNQAYGYAQAVSYASRHANSWIGLTHFSHNRRGFDEVYESAIDMMEYEHPGSFGAPSILGVGQRYLSHDEENAQVALWSLMGSSMIIGVDPHRLNDDQKKILTNPQYLGLLHNSFAFGAAYQVINNTVADLFVRQVAPHKFYALVMSKKNGGHGKLTDIPWQLPDGNWELTNIEDGKTQPVGSQLSGFKLGHRATVYTITPQTNTASHQAPSHEERP